MDIADSCCQEVNSKVSDPLALFRIRTLALAHYTVFFSADRAYFGFQGHSLFIDDSNQFFCLLYVLFDWEMGTVKHNG